MKLKIFFFLYFIFVGCFLLAGLSTDQINDYHIGIGNKLIKLKKDFPETEQVIYSLLDQFGKYSSFSRSLIKKKKNYKNLLKEEIKISENLKKQANRLNEKIHEINNINLEIGNKFKTSFDEFKVRLKTKNKELKEKNKTIVDLEKQMQVLVAERESFQNETNSKNENRSQEEISQKAKNDGNLISTSAPISPL